MTPNVPVSYLLLGMLTGIAAYMLAKDGYWLTVMALFCAAIHQVIVSMEWWNGEKRRLERDGKP